MWLRSITFAIVSLALPALAGAQPATVAMTSEGAVVSRMTTRVPGPTGEQKLRLRVSGDSAQRIALTDYAWKGRVISVEIDESDARLYWDVKIRPDATPQTVVRYRVDAINGGILGIREFARIGGRRP